MKYLSKTNLIFTVLFIFFVALSACKDDSIESKKAQLKALKTEISELETQATALEKEIGKTEKVETLKEAVTVFKVVEAPFNAFVEVQGTSQAENNVNITTDMGGLVKAVFVDEGQSVSAGQILIQLDNSIVMSQIGEINNAISLAQDVFEKRRRLWEQNIGSEIEFLQAKNQLNALQKQKNTLNTQLGKFAIKSPISGKVDRVFLKVGELAAPGMPAINVVNLAKMEVEVNIPESYLGKVKKGETVSVEFPSINKITTAKVKAITQSINSNNRTFRVLASIDNKDGLLKPNLLAKIKINNSNVTKAIAIPSNLVQKSTKGYFVYTVNDSTLKVEEKIVETGDSYEGKILIKSGLSVNELIINEGYRNVLAGDEVEIIEEKIEKK